MTYRVGVCVCVRVSECVRACMCERACARACACVRVRAYVCVCVCVDPGVDSALREEAAGNDGPVFAGGYL